MSGPFLIICFTILTSLRRVRVYNEQTRQVGSEAWALSRCRILSVSEIGLNWNSVAVLENFTGFHSVSLNL